MYVYISRENRDPKNMDRDIKHARLQRNAHTQTSGVSCHHGGCVCEATKRSKKMRSDFCKALTIHRVATFILEIQRF